MPDAQTDTNRWHIANAGATGYQTDGGQVGTPTTIMSNPEKRPQSDPLLDSGVLGERIKRKSEHDFIKQHFLCYLTSVRSLEVVSGVLVGANPDSDQTYLWNVLAEDVDLEHLSNPKIYDLGIYMADLEERLLPFVSIRLSNVPPSRLHALLDRCQEREIETTLISL